MSPEQLPLFILGVFSFFLGAILASFAGVCVERIGTGQSWTRGRSRCNACNRNLTPKDLVPVFSWIFYKGRCRTCTSKVPVRYPLSEVILGTLFVLSYVWYGISLELGILYVLYFLLAIIVLYDIRHTIVPFKLSLLLILLGAFTVFISAPDVHAGANTFLIAGCIGLGFFLLHVVSGGRWMGLGDTPVAIALSLMVGSQALSGLLFSFWIGAVIGILILVATPKGRRMGIEVPFVPFLAAGYLLALFTQWNPLTFIP